MKTSRYSDAQILSNLGVRRLRLLTNTKLVLGGLGGFGLEIVETVAITP